MCPSPNRRDLKDDRLSWDSIHRFEQVTAGHESAANAVFHRYLERLVSLARKRMSKKLVTRLDPEDVVMSAYRSFFLRARDGKFHIEHSGDLWRLLVEITCHKLYRQAARHTAQKRSIQSEQADVADTIPIEQPGPDVVAMVADELEHVMGQLNNVGRQVLELRLQDYSVQEIAERVSVSERTVRRQLAKVKSAFSDNPTLTQQEETSNNRLGFSQNATSSRPDSVARSTTLSQCLRSFADYRLLQQIGVGAAGKVYRANQISTGNEFAVKYLRKEYIRDVRAIERFDAEAEILTNIQHPGVVRVHGFGATPGGGRFLVMDLVEGGDLQSRLESGSIPIPRAVGWIIQACEAIAAANQAGIVHCDLKPANLLLRIEGDVVVTDFGLARDIRTTAPPSLAGTPAFMAPEQIDVFYGAIDQRTDVYGLGMCLYALLTRQTAFEDRTSNPMSRIMSGNPPRDPRESRGEIPAALSLVCLRAIARQPADRFQSANALAKALRNLSTDSS